MGKSYYPEEIPSFAFKMSFQSNMAFLVAIFVMACALGWALRDHRRRLLELASEEQEDRLYVAILAVLFSICTMGAYFSFNRVQLDVGSGITTRNIVVAELQRLLIRAFDSMGPAFGTPVPFSPDAQIKVPLPTTEGLDQVANGEEREADKEYHGLSVMVLFLLTLVAVWYFYPKKRAETLPPKDYADGDAARNTGRRKSRRN